jgi:hypothetical protein
MKAFLDNSLINQIKLDPFKEHSFLQACQTANIPIEKQQVVFGWPSLLEYLDLGALFQTFPKFDAENKLFALLISTLESEFAKNDIIDLYDQVFIECLTQVKALPQVNPGFLLSKIRKKEPLEEMFTAALNAYKKYLDESPSNFMHDLILYLAWDRVCVYLASVFEYQFVHSKFDEGLEILKGCLVESFQHITGQRRTAPGFFRLIEAFYAYQMREENLQKHTEAEWLLLCQSASALTLREDVVDALYIDFAITEAVDGPDNPLRVFTMDTPDKVAFRIALARYMVEKLKAAFPDWRYKLAPVEIVCVKEGEEGIEVV